jgi:hypothetical protein
MNFGQLVSGLNSGGPPACSPRRSLGSAEGKLTLVICSYKQNFPRTERRRRHAGPELVPVGYSTGHGTFSGNEEPKRRPGTFGGDFSTLAVGCRMRRGLKWTFRHGLPRNRNTRTGLDRILLQAAPLLSADVCPICTPWHDIAARLDQRSSKARDPSPSISKRTLEQEMRDGSSTPSRSTNNSAPTAQRDCASGRQHDLRHGAARAVSAAFLSHLALRCMGSFGSRSMARHATNRVAGESREASAKP